MEETEKAEAQYIIGFNEGYLFAEHYPEVSDSIAKIEAPDSPRLDGFRDGRYQYALEALKDIRPDFNFEHHKSKGNDHDRDREIGNDLEK